MGIVCPTFQCGHFSRNCICFNEKTRQQSLQDASQEFRSDADATTGLHLAPTIAHWSLGTALCSVHNVGHSFMCTCRSGATASQLDLPSLVPMSVAGCGRLQMGATVALLQSS